MTHRLTYLICGTPRSGSTLLCGLLKSSGIAGRPESYFRAPDEATWAARWGLSGTDHLDYAAFVRAARAAGSTTNGVVGARVMWGSMEPIVDRLRPVVADETDELALLQRGLGAPLRFVHLRRTDEVAQAVSWARSEQTGYWHSGDRAAGQPRFDGALIDRLVRTIAAHNAAWRRWFRRLGITPYEVTYEQLASDPIGTASAMLGQLGLDVADAEPLQVRDHRQADQLNADWVARYRARLR